MKHTTENPSFNSCILSAVKIAGCMTLVVSMSATAQSDMDGQQTQNGGYINPGYVNQNGMVSDNIFGVKNLAYYGDWDSNRVFVIDVDDMSLLVTVENTGDGPYGIDQQGVEKAYALTRRTESLTVVDNYTIENIGYIPLSHKPRSTHYRAENGLTLVSGGDKAMSSVIRTDLDMVIGEVGENELTMPMDFGGSLSTGHPQWVDNRAFFMLDRADRSIQLWNRDGDLLSSLATPTSVHHVFQSPAALAGGEEKHIYYAIIEGNQEELIAPGILRFEISGGQLVQTGLVFLDTYSRPSHNLDASGEYNASATTDLDPAIMGAHHADFHPDGISIYVGSAEGHLFIVNKDSLEIETMLDTGPGSGHTTFIPARNLAIVTNHNATYMSVIDTEKRYLVKNIEVADSASPDYKSQAHTSGVSLDERYFYSAASHDGNFFRIDLDTWELSKLHTGGNILMGSFIWDGEGENM